MASGEAGQRQAFSHPAAAGIPCVTRELTAARVPAQMVSDLWPGGISPPMPIVIDSRCGCPAPWGWPAAALGHCGPKPVPCHARGRRGGRDWVTQTAGTDAGLSGLRAAWAALGAVPGGQGGLGVTLSAAIGYFRRRHYRPSGARWPAGGRRGPAGHVTQWAGPLPEAVRQGIPGGRAITAWSRSLADGQPPAPGLAIELSGKEREGSTPGAWGKPHGNP
jgi:hypothetical protein